MKRIGLAFTLIIIALMTVICFQNCGEFSTSTDSDYPQIEDPDQNNTTNGDSTGGDTTTDNTNSGNNDTTNGTDTGNTSTACPTGVKCITRAWPNMPRETISMSASTIMAIKVSTTDDGVSGHIITNYTTGNTATRIVALSSSPGNFDVPFDCITSGLEHTTLGWIQGTTTTVKRDCIIPSNSTAWINIKFTNCEASSCSYYLTLNKN